MCKYTLNIFENRLISLLEILGFTIKIQLHVTDATANLCSCIRQVTHDIQLHVTLRM